MKVVLTSANSQPYPIMRLLLFTVAVACMFVACNRNNLPANANNAQMLYEKQHYTAAATMLNKLYRKSKKKDEKAQYALMLADSYRQMNQYEEAANFYAKCVEYFPNKPSYRFLQAQMLMGQNKYPEAISALEQYIRNVPGDNNAKETLEMCKLAVDLNNQGTQFSVEPLINFNTKYNEYSPLLRPNGLYFTSDRPQSTGENTNAWLGTEYSDIFLSRSTDEGFEEPTPLGEPINTVKNEGVCSFNEQGNVMAYTQCSGPGYDSSCAILVIRRERGVWSSPEVIPFSKRDGYVFGHPALSADGNTLVFSSNLGGGIGGHDLWISEYRNGDWSTPTNMGSKINSARDEMFPVFTNDNTLYFSSNGHPGFGGLDIFKAIRINDKWRKPDNLLVPLNSGGDDFGITFHQNGSKGYFTTNRQGTEGDDLYSFTKVTPPLCSISGVVYDNSTKKPLVNSVVFLRDLVSEETFYLNTDDQGAYTAYICYDKDYRLDAYRKFYTNNRQKPRVSTRGLKFEKKFTQDFYLDKWVIDEIRLEGIYYDLDKATIRDDAKPVLDSLARILKIHHYLVVELSSHTDCRGSAEYNQDLSQRRAESCVDYLVAQGLARERLIAKGYGESKLLNDCACDEEDASGESCTDEEHQLNRRTSFMILRTDYEPVEDPEFGQPYIEPECK